MSNEKLKEGIVAFRSGDKKKALQILSELVKAEPKNETAWLWLSACVDKVEQKRFCLTKVLEINPGHEGAKKALAQLTQPSQPSLADINPQPTAPPKQNPLQRDISQTVQSPPPSPKQPSSTKQPLKKKAPPKFNLIRIAILGIGTSCICTFCLVVATISRPATSETPTSPILEQSTTQAESTEVVSALVADATNTPALSTDTPYPPTNTPAPTDTPAPPTNTPAPTDTNTPVLPTATLAPIYAAGNNYPPASATLYQEILTNKASMTELQFKVYFQSIIDQRAYLIGKVSQVYANNGSVSIDPQGGDLFDNIWIEGLPLDVLVMLNKGQTIKFDATIDHADFFFGFNVSVINAVIYSIE